MIARYKSRPLAVPAKSYSRIRRPVHLLHRSLKICPGEYRLFLDGSVFGGLYLKKWLKNRYRERKMQQWMVYQKKADFNRIGETFQIHPVIARLIRNRDVVGDKDIGIYLNGTLADMPDVHKMKDLDLLVDILVEKIKGGKKICIIGDYDVDGVMSSLMLKKAMEAVNAEFDVKIPERIRDGYGLNVRLVEEAKNGNADTILTCDNGIAAIDEIAYAKEQGMTVLVTDHHQVPFAEENGVHTEIHSMADAVVNPHQGACAYPYKELCGAGVVYAVITALYGRMGLPKEKAEDLLEFAAMATVCDVMPLTYVNRILVREGIKRIHNTKNKGMLALMQAAGITPEQVDSYHFGFVLGPCVNATGRLKTAEQALSLFSTEDEKEAGQLASTLVSLNNDRKEMTKQGVEEGKRLIEQGGYENDPVLVLYLPDVHESIAGLIAGRIRESYARPVFVLTKGEGTVKGSGRSTEAYSMYEEMCRCSELFTRFGGHPMAAGLSLPEENVDQFRKKINELCPYSVEEISSKIHIDMQMPAEYASTDMIHQFDVMAPFGNKNPKPVFVERDFKMERMDILGKNRNVLRLGLRSAKGNPVSAVYFGDIPRLERYFADKFGEDSILCAKQGKENPITFSMVYQLRLDTYRDNENVQLEMKYYR